MRVHTITGTDQSLPKVPEAANILMHHHLSLCQAKGLETVRFSVGCLPPSVNHQYKHTRFNTRLTDEARDFRRKVDFQIKKSSTKWKPTGAVAAVVLFESTLWLTKKRTVRQMDCDNRLKSLFDAIELSTGAKDEMIWQAHAFKLASNRECTQVFLFDLGDVVEYYLWK